MTKILYLFSGERKNTIREVESGKSPDTQLYGFNHFDNNSFVVETIEFNDVLPSFFGKILGFRLRHALLFFFATRYDIVFGSSILYMALFKKLFHSRTRYVLFNISLNKLLLNYKSYPILLRLILWILNEIEIIVCLSHFQIDQLIHEFNIDEKRLFFVPLGVDCVYHKPIYKNRKHYILSVGRDNGRDYKTVIEVARNLPHEQFHIVCSRRNLIDIGTIPSNVVVYLDLPKWKLKKKYEEAKFLLLITHDELHSKGSDCSGQTVLLDAAATGLPIIATRKKYISDYFDDENEIITVNYYDVSDILNKIAILQDEAIRLKNALNARKKVENHFSTKKMAHDLGELFEHLHA